MPFMTRAVQKRYKALIPRRYRDTRRRAVAMQKKKKIRIFVNARIVVPYRFVSRSLIKFPNINSPLREL